MSSKEATENMTAQEKHDELLERMKREKEKWDAESDDDSDDGGTGKLLSQAMELAIEQGKGWGPGEKEEYISKILDDDFIPPLFAENMEELEQSGLAEAFSSLVYDDETPTQLMLSFKKKGNDAFLNGKRNEAKNVQYYRDAINHYFEAFAWAQKVEPLESQQQDATNAASDNQENNKKENDDPVYTEKELDEFKSTLCSNAAMAHMMLKNWGHVKEQASKALVFDDKNVKAWYRLAKSHQALLNWEEAGDAIDSGLAVDGENKDLKKLQTLLEKKVQKARKARQLRERQRAKRVASVKAVWKHCKENGIQLGRVPLVKTVTDDEEGDDEDGTGDESRWNHHFPHSGRLPSSSSSGGGGEWTWPCMFLYPSHKHSDFVEYMAESDMLAMRMSEMFPELENTGDETQMPWDYNNEFICSNLAVYMEVHCTENAGDLIHPENVERLKDQGEAMRFYEASRALKGDEGPEMANLARAVERKKLHKQRRAWIKKHKSLWSKPDPFPVVRIHPAMTLRDVLVDKRMVVPNFLVTFVLFPENHPAHKEYLKEHRCVGIIQPDAA
mmetsp:Transcript_13186/g.18663  ORF Transcript_13186/g.18663 Transcript_13186/m.18663 type:complete len:558 (+) Transcript_13186:75-1748(+)